MPVSLRLPALLALVFFTLAASASASTLTRAGGVYDYTGTAAGNGVGLQGGVGSFQVTDSEVIIMAADASCTGENTTQVTCTVTPTSIDVDTGGGNDSGAVTIPGGTIVNAFPITIQTGSGNDNYSAAVQFGNGTSTATMNDSSGDDTLQANFISFSGVNQIGYGSVNSGIGNDDVSGTGVVSGAANDDKLRGISPGTGSVTLNGGSENDTFNMSNSAPEIVNGGTGTDTVDYTQESNITVSLDSVANDTGANDNADADSSIEILKMGGGNETATGSSDADTIFGGGGDDSLNGSGGDDNLDGGSGADVIDGGASFDTVKYTDRSADLSVTLDNVVGDGEINENDDVKSTVEHVFTGYGDDYILGTGSSNTLNGGLGDDTIEGLSGGDAISGGPGDDSLDGGASGDNVSGGPGDDTIDGGTGVDADTVNGNGGADTVDGGGGADTMTGGDGSDTMLARDLAAAIDNVNCGGSTDQVVRDTNNADVLAECEIAVDGSGGVGLAGFDDLEPGSLTKTGTIGTLGAESLATVKCSTATMSASRLPVSCKVTDANGSAVTAKLVRNGRVYAKGTRRGTGAVRLRAVRRLSAGRYRLILRNGGKVVGRLSVRIR